MAQPLPWEDRTEALRWLNDSLARSRSFDEARQYALEGMARGGAGLAYFRNLLELVDKGTIARLVSSVELELYLGFMRKLHREGALSDQELKDFFLKIGFDPNALPDSGTIRVARPRSRSE